MPGGTVYISRRDYKTQRRMAASNPGISFGARDYRNANVVVTDDGRPPSSSGSVSTSNTSRSTASNTYRSSTTSYSSGGSSSYRSSSSGGNRGSGGMIPVRSTIESLYGQGSVSYDPQTRVITLTDPRTGRVGTIAPDAYVEQGGTAYINPDYIRSWLNGSSGGSSSTQTTPAASTTTATTANTRTGTPGGLNPTEHMIIQYGTDYDPNWFKNLSPEIQAKVNAERQKSGLAPLPTDRPLYWEESMAGIVSTPYNQLPERLQQAIAQQETASGLWSQQQLYQPQFQPIEYLQPQIQNILSQVQQLYTPDPSLAPLYSKALDQMLSTIDTYQQQLTDQIKQQMGGVDPATQAALASLKETVKRRRDNLMEEMSKRGLLQSGIWLEMEDRLNRGELTAQQQLLATRLSALQDQLNQVLQNFGNLRLQAMQTYGLKGIEQVTEEAKQRREALERNLQRALDEAYRQRQLDIQQWQAQAPYMYGTWDQRNRLVQDWAQITGTVPSGPGYEPVPVRDYVGSRGSVSYDPNTGNVLINGRPINPSSVGGYITPEGRAYIPRNIVDEALRRY